LYAHFNTRKEASLKIRGILVESVLVCLVLLSVAACTPTPPENIYWEPDGSGFIRFRTDDPANADQGFLTLYDDTDEPTMTTDVVVTAKKILGSVGGGFGVVFCAVNEQNYFMVLINIGGEYKIVRISAGQSAYDTDWIFSPDLHRGLQAENTIKVTHAVSLFSLYFNDSLLAETSLLDSGFGGGKSGFFAYVSTAENEYQEGWVDVRFKMTSPKPHP
jgi:hypothetical protein